MVSVRRRLSDASTTCWMWPGRLLVALHLPPLLGSASKPNLVAMTTLSRKGARASPTSSSFTKGPVHLGGIEKSNAALYRCANYLDRLLLLRRGTKAEAQPHAAKTQFRYLKSAFSQHALLHLSSSKALLVLCCPSRAVLNKCGASSQNQPGQARRLARISHERLVRVQKNI